MVRNHPAGDEASERSSALFAGLVAALIVTVVVKAVSGLALAPLAVIAVLVFMRSASFRLRVIRTR